MFTLPSRLITIVVALTILFPMVLLSQVKIKEKVEIRPLWTAESRKPQAKLMQESIIAPRTGNLLMRPQTISSLNSPPPANAYVEVTINGLVPHSLSVTPFLPNLVSSASSSHNKCNNTDVQNVAFGRLNFGTAETFDTIKVKQGDELRFVYHAGLANPVVSGQLYFHYGIVTMQTLPVDYDCWYPGFLLERCILMLSYEESILLGESKYYYLGGNDYDGWEIRDDWDPSKPVPSSINIIADFYVDPIRSGDRLAVYWETNKAMPNGRPLPNGIIRLVGRYLDPEDNERNKVTLTAKYIAYYGDDYSSVDIEVKKPDVLGNPDLDDKPRHTLIKDVFSNNDSYNLWLDDFIFTYAGENGIPPQVIKGQIAKETSFKPAWRYEPFTDLKLQKTKYDEFFAPDLPFNVRDGIPNDLPASHSNISPGPYVKNATTIGSYAVQYWFPRYVKRGLGSDPDTIVGSAKLTRFWYLIFWTTALSRELSGIPTGVVEVKNFAHDFVKGSILNGSYDRAFNKTAQTRKVTSYGFVQMMYTSAVDDLYGKWRETKGKYGTYVDRSDPADYPERLNEQEFLFPRYSDFTLFDLRVAMTEAFTGSTIATTKKYSTPLVDQIPQGNWPTGFEQIWSRTMQWHNPGEAGYGQKVMSNAKGYLPAYNK
jgi:hypothetical protein